MRGYVNLCDRRHVKRHVLGGGMNEFSVEKSYWCEMICEYCLEGSLKEGVCVGRYVDFLWKSL